ncbi:SDR family oxidoreductase [Peterkaempfera sp. SMS 1(5)a]|uniref:SDR family oxidoreductase n=1 Tax=Peterkaempfera podocarpi TaxID=3232308 RepID=UPI003673252E
MSVAVITGASRGLGLALARALARRGWSLVLDARGGEALAEVAKELAEWTAVAALPGDVADARHRAALLEAATALGGVDLLVNNASVLGAEPLVPLADQPLEGFRQALEVNVTAPLALVQQALPLLRRSEAGAVVCVSSDAAVEAYPTWGGYGAAKAALDQLSAVLAAEEPGLRVWAVDPGDMLTELYTAAVPQDTDLGGRALPEAVAPAFLALLDRRPASGRYTAAALLAPAGARR